ncbi:MAG: folate family ECF transporter S component [Clostridia bacterium]|nr:folate family ECF transporter S component [Clostridia bacterium]
MKKTNQKNNSSLRKSHSYIRAIAISGLLVALSVSVGWVCKTYLTFGAIRITFENVPIIISGIIYGPIVGAVVAVISDIVSCITSPNPALNPIVTLGAASIGIISGVISKYVIKKNKLFKVFVSVFTSHIIGSMIIKSVGLHIFFKYGFEILVWRIPLYFAIALCESIIIYAILQSRSISKMLEK